MRFAIALMSRIGCGYFFFVDVDLRSGFLQELGFIKGYFDWEKSIQRYGDCNNNRLISMLLKIKF